MKTSVLDSYALLAYFEKEDGWDTVAQLLADAAADRCMLYGCVVNWGEVLYITERVYGADKAEELQAVMDDLPIEWVDADRALTREAARFKVDGGLAYADCFAAALARRTDGEIRKTEHARPGMRGRTSRQDAGRSGSGGNSEWAVS